MYARHVAIHLKKGALPEFSKLLETYVLPELRKQPGFQDEITFSTPEGQDVIAISLWDTQASAEAYAKTGYGQVTSLLSGVIDGPPNVRVCDVIHSTSHASASAAA